MLFYHFFHAATNARRVPPAVTIVDGLPRASSVYIRLGHRLKTPGDTVLESRIPLAKSRIYWLDIWIATSKSGFQLDVLMEKS